MGRFDVSTMIGTTLLVSLLAAAGADAAVHATGDENERLHPTLAPSDAIPVPGDYDGDGITDIALKGSNGVWYIDFAANGFGGLWDLACTGYGDATAVPVPADYDGDGRTDLAVKDGTGMWAIDYAADGFGLWNLQLFGYGNSLSLPVPADYDGDGKADLSVKTDTGDWYINYSADGFGSGWNAHVNGYGNASALPEPADYDGDHHADLSIKDAGGCWYIDYQSNGFAGWNEIHCGYGDNSGLPVPADYDHDGHADLSIKGNDGNWYIDYSSNGFGGWNAIYCCRGDNSTIAVPGDYDGDGLTDLAIYNTVNGFWYIDFASNGFSTWDTWVDNAARTVIDTTRPYITSTTIYGEGNVAVSQLTVGVRYTVDVVIHRGSGATNAFGLEINDALNVPAALDLVNRNGSTYVGDITAGDAIATTTHRRYALTPKQPGNFPLGFQLRSAPPYYYGEVFNPDYGIRVLCVSPAQTALSGHVTQRFQNTPGGVFVSGAPIAGATVTLVSSGGITTTTDSQGNWHFPIATSFPMWVRITKPGYSEVDVVNLMVPVSGLLVNTQMEQAFTSLPPNIQYRTYIDYAHSRVLLHVVEIAREMSSVRVGKTPVAASADCSPGCVPSNCPAFQTLQYTGNSINALVIMNGTWWNICSGNPLGYVYLPGGFQDSDVWCDDRSSSTTNCSDSDLYFAEGTGVPLYPAGTSPMFTIAGYGAVQHFEIVQSNDNFWEQPSTQWSQVGNPAYPIWDVMPRDGQTDIAYAVQIPNPPLLRNGAVIAAGNFVLDSAGNYEDGLARTSLGVGPDGQLYLVVVDGEGVHGGNGATPNQLGHFYRDVLGATSAMGLDSGLSTELRLRTPGGLYRVNTMTGEDATIQKNPYTDVLPEAAGAIGSVGYYVAVVPDATAAPPAETRIGFAVHVQATVGNSLFQFEVSLPQAGEAALNVYDVRGRQVAVAFRGRLDAGPHTLTWRGTGERGAAVAAGVYYYRFTAGSNEATGSVVVVK